MSNGEVKKVSPQDLQLVQNLIERCLQLYMSQKEVVSTLLLQAKIEPSFTELVWQKLEEENQDFFKAYHLRLVLKDQIMKFNKLLQTQAELMSQLPPATSNGSHVPLENMQQCMVTNGGPSVHPCMQSGASMSNSQNLIMGQNSNMGIMQGMIKPESGNVEEQPFMFNAANNVLERQPAIAEVAIPSFVGVESNPKPVNDPIMQPDTSSFGFLGQIPRNFSLSDLTADFSISSDILDSYSRSPYLAADADFINPYGNGDIQGDSKKLDTISEGLSYEGFGSD